MLAAFLAIVTAFASYGPARRATRGDILLGVWAPAIGQPVFVTSTVAEVSTDPSRVATDHAVEFRS